MTGETIGHYRVAGKIGEGGMGVVYRATDLMLGRQVALKLLPAEATADPERRARFLHEAKAASALNHPNIVTIYEIGYVGDTTYIAMEYIAGRPMQQVVPAGGLPIADVLRFAIQIADALAAAHAAGIVHRDLKPANVMLTDQQRIKLLDFGLAKSAPLVEHGGNTQQTRTMALGAGPHTGAGMIVGTAGYMSPEQVEGRPVDVRSDIFSFGCVLHDMITGEPAFSGDTPMSTLIAVATREPQPISKSRQDVPPELERLVERCLQKRPADRPQYIADVRVELESLADTLRPAPASRVTVTPKPEKRRIRIAIMAVAVAILAAIAGTVLWRSRQGPKGPPLPLTKITDDSGLTAYPAVSADGRLLAYASDRAGSSGLDIWVRPLLGGESKRLTTHVMDDSDPAFSPDGSLVAFRSERSGGGVYVVPSAGGAERAIAVNGRNPRFSPDGKWIAYWIGSPGGGQRDDRIFLVPAAGGPSREWLEGWGARSEPVWSPDGKRILFLGTRATAKEYLEGNDWWIAPVEGGTVVQTGAIKQLRQPPFVYSPEPELWLPDNKVLFSRHGTDGASIWQVRVDPATGAITDEPVRLTSSAPIETRPALVPGGRFAYGSITESLNVWSVPVDSQGSLVPSKLARVTEGPFVDAAPSVTADGQKMAFVSNRRGHDDVWMHDMQTGRAVAITSGPSHKAFPVLDRGASQLAYAQADSGKYAIYVISPGGGVARRICADCGLTRGWMPDGKRILYQAGNPSAFWTVDVSTGVRELAATYDFGVYSPRFSFDDRWLVFHARIHPDATRILIAPYRDGAIAPSKEWVQVTGGEFEDDKPRWGPGDDRIFFLSRRDGFRCLWSQRLDPRTKQPQGGPELLMHFHETRRSMMDARFNQFDLAVARDKLLLTLADRTGNIWLSAVAPQERP
jgi:eukaryotic-like serine/threonine-protein kinase